MLTDTSRERPRQGRPRRPRSTPRSALQGGGAVRAAFRAGPCLPARPDLRRARPSPRPPRGSSGDMCTGPDDTVERREEVRGVGAPRVEGRPRLGPRPRSESPRVDAAEGEQVKRQDQAGVEGGGELDREGGGVSPASGSRSRPSGWGGAVSLECPASCRASSWARKSISSSSLGRGKPSPGEGEGLSGGEAPSPSLATPAARRPPRGREGEAHLGASPRPRPPSPCRLLPGTCGQRTRYQPTCSWPSRLPW